MKRFNTGGKGGGRFRERGPKRFSREGSPERDNDRFSESDYEDTYEKKMHSAICAKCGEKCEVPFKPREGKPVYCFNCFKKSDGGSESRQGGAGAPSKSAFDQINEKLDKIMQALDIK